MLMTRIRGVVVLAACLGCSGPPVDRNASEPPRDFTPQSHLWASETSLVHAAPNATVPLGRVLLAYNDVSGVATYDGTTLNVRPPVVCGVNKCAFVGQSFAGLSYSDDLGLTWRRRGTFTPADRFCPEALCPTILRGDPWLAANGSDVLYINLAGVAEHGDIADVGHSVNAIAYIWSHNGGLSWDSPKIAELEANQPLNSTQSVFVDKPSVSIAPDGTAAIAYWQPANTGGDGKVHVVTADAGNFDSWSIDDAIDGTDSNVPDLTTQVPANPSPIIKVIDSRHAYLAFQSGFKVSLGGNGIVSYHVFRLSRRTLTPGVIKHWRFDSRAVDLDNLILEGSLPGGPTTKSRPWSDPVPGSFAVTGDVQRHLYVAFRQQNNLAQALNSSQVTMIDCMDSDAQPCSLSGPSFWQTTQFPSLPGGQFQPAAAAEGNTVAVTMYHSIGGLVTAGGVYSESSGSPGSWSPPFFYPAPVPTRVCANALAGGSGVSSIGEYTSSVVIPGFFHEGNPWIVSARTDWRGGCVDQNIVTYDQHVQAVVW